MSLLPPIRFGTGPGMGGEEPPSGSFFSKWFFGIVFPLIFIAIGLICIIARHGWLPGRYDWMELFGAQAVALGCILLGLAFFLHCHFFWGSIYYEYPLATIGKIISLIAMVGGLIFIIINVGIFGRA